MNTSLSERQTGWPTTQDKVYRPGEWIPLGIIVTQYKPGTMEVERMYVG